jgi:hypothetical protein
MKVHSRKSVRSVELEDATSLAAGVRVASSAHSRISCVEASDAPPRSRAEVELAAPPEVVWDVLTWLRDWPEWNPEHERRALSHVDSRAMSFAPRMLCVDRSPRIGGLAGRVPGAARPRRPHVGLTGDPTGDAADATARR